MTPAPVIVWLPSAEVGKDEMSQLNYWAGTWSWQVTSCGDGSVDQEHWPHKHEDLDLKHQKPCKAMADSMHI